MRVSQREVTRITNLTPQKISLNSFFCWRCFVCGFPEITHSTAVRKCEGRLWHSTNHNFEEGSPLLLEPTFMAYWNSAVLHLREYFSNCSPYRFTLRRETSLFHDVWYTAMSSSTSRTHTHWHQALRSSHRLLYHGQQLMATTAASHTLPTPLSLVATSDAPQKAAWQSR